MAVSKAASNTGTTGGPTRSKTSPEGDPSAGTETAIQFGELSEHFGYLVKRAQLRVFDDFIRCVSALQLTPAQFSVLMLVDQNPGRNQTEIANALGILRPNFVAMLDNLEKRGLCQRARSAVDRRSHILALTDKGRTVLARARKLISERHHARLNELLGPQNREALLSMLTTIAEKF